jgi:hypothetical protein
MPDTDNHRRKPAAAAVVMLLLASLLLAACGGSSKSSSSTSTAKAAQANAGGRFGARGAALRECLQKSGITLPKRTPGQGAAPGAGGLPGRPGTPGAGGALKLPSGVTPAQFQAALKKCGIGNFTRRGSGAGGARFAKFETCMRQNGVKLPAPNTSGKGPIFNTKGIDTSSAKFKSAAAKCESGLRPAGEAGPGSGGEATPGPRGGVGGASGAAPAQ